MTLALGFLAAAVVLSVAAPAYLRLAVTPRVHPRLALTGWVGSVAMLLVATIGAGVLLAVPQTSGLDGLIGMADSCVNIFRANRAVAWVDVVRLGSAAALFGLVGRVIIVALSKTRRHVHWRREHLALLRVVCRCRGPVLWLDDGAPLAYSVGGRDGAIVATTGVERLTTSERAAVLAHERAHLRGRHHLIVLAADIVAAALPFVPLFRTAPAAVRVLVELAADAAAARQHGTSTVRAALLSVTGGAIPGHALAMSRDAVDARLLWLAEDRGSLRRLPVRTGYAVATMVTTVPAIATVGLVALIVTAYCLGVT